MSQPGPAILVLDDDEQVRETISAVLGDAGFEITTAATGWEAVALIEEKNFDLVVADIRLPGGLDGLDMARHVRARFPALKCLFISACASRSCAIPSSTILSPSRFGRSS